MHIIMDLIKEQAIRWGTVLIERDAESIDLSQRPFVIKTAVESISA